VTFSYLGSWTIVTAAIPMDMEPLEINRSALIAIVKQPFVDWLHTVDPTSKHIGVLEVNHEPTVYLVPECESKEEFAEWLERHCELIFEQQLGGWWTDQRSWPANRGITVFQEWFECRLYSMVLDLHDQPL
jgi:hypothetical protein